MENYFVADETNWEKLHDKIFFVGKSYKLNAYDEVMEFIMD